MTTYHVVLKKGGVGLRTRWCAAFRQAVCQREGGEGGWRMVVRQSNNGRKQVFSKGVTATEAP